MRRVVAISLVALLGCAAGSPAGTSTSPPRAPEVWVTRAAIRGETPGVPQVWIPRENLAAPPSSSKPLR
jgi:hypothetical protein